jgi:hypothetical protein
LKTWRLTISSIYSNDKRIPYIRLSGNCLVENGFQTNRKIIVDQKPGNLTISLILVEDEKECRQMGT